MHIAWAFKTVITKNMWMLAQNWINLTCDFYQDNAILGSHIVNFF